jgi:riboflavin synthase
MRSWDVFTGIIKETGEITNISKGQDCKLIEVSCIKILPGLAIGDSIAVDGCCLTARKINQDGFICDISYATLEKTTFADLKTGRRVNLESSLTINEKIGGHFVSGHVDGTAKISEINKIGVSHRIVFEAPQDLLPFLAPRGSVAIDGISLTISESGNDCFAVAIIPHTFDNTTLSGKKAGDLVNIEVDLLARYIFQVLINMQILDTSHPKNENDRTLKEKLVEHGFIK